GDAFSRFLWVWLIGTWAGLSWGSEKMPWLNTHLALPACLLAGWTVARAWRAWRDRPGAGVVAVPLVAAGAVALGALALIVFLPEEPVYHGLRVVVAAFALGAIVYAARPFGRTAIPAFAVLAVVGALSLFSFRTMIMVTFERGDVPKDMLIYTQSSPDIPDIMTDINRLAEATGKGHDLRIAVDSHDSYAWPWAWYLRDYNAVSYADLTDGFTVADGQPMPEYDVMLVHSANVSKVRDSLSSQASTRYGPERLYQHRWWFDERYKDAMTLEDAPLCTGEGGDCGPLRLETWKHIFSSTPGWADTWYRYWRDHDADAVFGGTRTETRCASCGSTDGYAFFPANFDLERGRINPDPIEIPGPGVDAGGHPTFGSRGTFPGQFSQPTDIEQDAEGNLYVIDPESRRLQKFDSQGNFIVGVSIRQDADNLGEAAEPWGIGIGPQGEVAVADTFGWRVRVFDSNLEFTGVQFGDPPTSPEDPSDTQLFGPRDIAFDAQGNMWVTDTGHARIQVFSASGGFVRSIGSRGDGPGEFDEPVGLAIADDGTVFVADMYNRRVVMLNADGSFRAAFA
ncbi:MAG: 6-bladed beta-propeller, partial [Tepidiformaceae bacterium]